MQLRIALMYVFSASHGAGNGRHFKLFATPSKAGKTGPGLESGVLIDQFAANMAGMKKINLPFALFIPAGVPCDSGDEAGFAETRCINTDGSDMAGEIYLASYTQ